ncbi:hypothetical protein [Vibrio sp. T3Y01]|uniref:hypothetical protein n=1 Tax=Vibrio sp. T3Y01 TaxID=2607606 RepID=UPI00149389EA|nr:hypothetical protein [Vibrio sp. T3Y01]NOI96665.1 hypothetical protein [Vibrio sp. T3Y01]
MKEESVTKMADTLLNQPTLSNLEYNVVVILLVLIFGSILAFFKTLYSEKAKYSAIKSSLDTINLQTELTAKTTEKIKNDLEYKSWNRKEIVLVRRVKLEEYFLLMSSLENALDSEFIHKFFDAEVNYDHQCYDKANMIQSLYLPELVNEHHEVAKAVHEFTCWISEGLSIKAELISKGVQNPAPTKEFMQMKPELNSELVIAIENALKKSKELAKALNT